MTKEERARKNAATILNGMHSFGQSHLAKELDVSESTVSKWKPNGDIDRTAKMLSVLGLKVVPVTAQCFDPQYVEHLRALAKIGLNAPAQEQVLDWEDNV
jgi:hypothetical protein